MSVYALKDLLQDCTTRKNRTKGSKKEKEQIFNETWGALNAWILSRFEIGKGVNIGNFGKITWEHKTVGRNVLKARPVFLIAESFCKNHYLPYKRILTPPDLSPVEDINFTKLAIKYSENLTKDLVFSATRDLFQMIGDVLATGRKISIAFTVGRLLAKQRISHMVFDPRTFPKTLAARTSPSVIGSPPSVLGDVEEYDIADLASIDDAVVPEPEAEEPDATDEIPETMQEAPPQEDVQTPPPLQLEAQDPKMALNQILSHIATTGSDKLEELASVPSTGDVKDQDVVLAAAFKRHLIQVEKELEQDTLAALEVHKKHKEDCEAQRLEKEKKISSAVSLQKTIKAQMHEQETLRNRQTEEAPYRNSICKILPADRGGDGSAFHELQHKVKREINDFLQKQIESKEIQKLKARQEALAAEKALLHVVQKELENQKLENLKQLHQRRKYLTEGWKRDSHLKTMLKMRKKLISDQLQPSKAAPKTIPPWSTKEGEGGVPKDDISVGFDIRNN